MLKSILKTRYIGSAKAELTLTLNHMQTIGIRLLLLAHEVGSAIG
jgi:hypothetical protein